MTRGSLVFLYVYSCGLKSGYFSGREGLHSGNLNQESSSFYCSENLWRIIWSDLFPPKVQHFLWRALTGALATRSNLYKRRCNVCPLCPICYLEEESEEHLLLLCNWAQKVWFGCNNCLRIASDKVSFLGAWLEEVLVNDDLGGDLFKCYVGFFCWYI